LLYNRAPAKRPAAHGQNSAYLQNQIKSGQKRRRMKKIRHNAEKERFPEAYFIFSAKGDATP